VTPKLFARLKLMWPMSETHEAMWGTTQTGISKLDEDFQGCTDCGSGERLKRCRTRVGINGSRTSPTNGNDLDPGWPRLS
jgi:hypothetical protein